MAEIGKPGSQLKYCSREDKMSRAKVGGSIYIVTFREGSISPDDVEKYKGELRSLGVRTVWIKLLSRMFPASDQLEVQKIE